MRVGTSRGLRRRVTMASAIAIVAGWVVPAAIGTVATASAAPAVTAATGNISGKVTDAANVGIASACVTAQVPNSTTSTLTHTDGVGNYTLANLAVGSYRVFFDDCAGGNHASEWYNDKTTAASATLVSVVSGQTASAINASLATGGTITGTVVNAANQPLANICVGATNQYSHTTKTNSSGVYTVPGLATGPYKVQFFDCGTGNHVPEFWNNQPNSTSANPVSVTVGSTTTNINASLADAGTITGTITDANNAPLAGICAAASSQVFTTNSKPSDAQGKYTIGHLAPGSANSVKVRFFDCGDGNHVSQWWSNKTSSAAANPITITANTTTPNINAKMLNGAVITGTVTDASNAPLNNICVDIFPSGSNASVARALTNASGQYTINRLPAGSYKVEFQDCLANTHALQWWNNKADSTSANVITLATGATASGINAKLGPAGGITGTVSNSANAGIAGECVFATPQGATNGQGTTTGAGGAYAINGLVPGNYIVKFTDCAGSTGNHVPQWWNNKSSAATATPVAVTAGGPVNGISAKLADAGSISGTVTDASSNAPLNGICVFVYPNGSSSSLPGFKTNSSGVYTASQLAPGSYKVEFSDCAGGGHAGQFWNNKPSLSTATLVTVTAGATASGINAKLVAGGNISGTVSSSSGPLAGICVFPFQTGQTSSLAGTTTDSQGKYTLTGLAGGVTYQIQFQDCATGTYAGQWYNNQPSQATANSVSAGTAGVNATMVQAGAFSGLVTNSANAGLAGICVWAFPDPSTSATGVKTDSTGHYTFGGLKPGNYRVEFQDCAGGGHTTQWWNSQPDFNSASLITVTAGQTAPNINARLT